MLLDLLDATAVILIVARVGDVVEIAPAVSEVDNVRFSQAAGLRPSQDASPHLLEQHMARGGPCDLRDARCGEVDALGKTPASQNGSLSGVHQPVRRRLWYPDGTSAWEHEWTPEARNPTVAGLL